MNDHSQLDGPGSPALAGQAPVCTQHPKPTDSEWCASAKCVLQQLAELTSGWDGYGAEPPVATSICKAKQIIEALGVLSLAPSNIVASVEGGVAITFRRKDKYADIECLNSGEVLAVTSDGRNEPAVWEVEPGGVNQTLERIREYITG